MKQILLKSLTLENFKGIGNQSINFDPGCTDIQGDNGTGKTTIADAFIWLLFGKDSEDRADFQIKTLVEGQPIPKIDHTVTGVFSINDMPITLSRCYREKWTKKRGAEDSEMTGHETVYTFNDVPCSEKDYKARIAEIISEQLFRAITNPFYFANLKWDNRRSVLIEMAGGVNDAEIAAGNEDFTKLLEILSGKPIEDFKKQLAAERKKIKDELDLIPARVDEVTKSIPDEPNYTVAEKQIEFFDKEIKTIDGCIADKSAISQEMLNKKQKQQKIIFDLKSELQKLEYSLTAKQNEAGNKYDTELKSLQNAVREIERSFNPDDITDFEIHIKQLEEKLPPLLDEWEKIDESTPPELSTDEQICPTCKREFPVNDIEAKQTEIRNEFNLKKVAKLEAIDREGIEINVKIEGLKGKIKQLEIQKTGYEARLKEAKEKLSEFQKITRPVADLEKVKTDPAYVAKLKEITDAETILSTMNTETADTSELEAQKKKYVTERDVYKQQLSVQQVVAERKTRLKELHDLSKKLSQSLADVEKKSYLVQEFTKARIEKIEAKINSMFEYVSWKMFKTLINGGEEECCECMVNGVPYSGALNQAARINAGLDIINTLCRVNDVSAPIFIDQAESVNELINVNSQLVRLIVTTDKKLVIC